MRISSRGARRSLRVLSCFAGKELRLEQTSSNKLDSAQAFLNIALPSSQTENHDVIRSNYAIHTRLREDHKCQQSLARTTAACPSPVLVSCHPGQGVGTRAGVKTDPGARAVGHPGRSRCFARSPRGSRGRTQAATAPLSRRVFPRLALPWPVPPVVSEPRLAITRMPAIARLTGHSPPPDPGPRRRLAAGGRPALPERVRSGQTA